MHFMSEFIAMALQGEFLSAAPVVKRTASPSRVLEAQGFTILAKQRVSTICSALLFLSLGCSSGSGCGGDVAITLTSTDRG